MPLRRHNNIMRTYGIGQTVLNIPYYQVHKNNLQYERYQFDIVMYKCTIKSRTASRPMRVEQKRSAMS